MNNKALMTILGLAILILLIVLLTRGNDDNVIEPADTTDVTDQNPIDDNDDRLDGAEISYNGAVAEDMELDNLDAGDTMPSGFVLEGQVPGNWFFEASSSYTVTDWNGLIIGEGVIQADGEWMTTDPVAFSDEINYELPADAAYTNGSLILHRANASGLPENDSSVEIPVQLVPNS